MAENAYIILEELSRLLKNEGYIAGKKWNSTFNTVEELKEHVMTDFYYENVIHGIEMNDKLWEEAFKIWKESESMGVSDSEDFR